MLRPLTSQGSKPVHHLPRQHGWRCSGKATSGTTMSRRNLFECFEKATYRIYCVILPLLPFDVQPPRRTRARGARLSVIGVHQPPLQLLNHPSTSPRFSTCRGHTKVHVYYIRYSTTPPADRNMATDPETTFRLLGLCSIIFYVYLRLCSPSPCAAPVAICLHVLRTGPSIASHLDPTFINSAPRFSPNGIVSLYRLECCQQAAYGFVPIPNRMLQHCTIFYTVTRQHFRIPSVRNRISISTATQRPYHQ